MRATDVKSEAVARERLRAAVAVLDALSDWERRPRKGMRVSLAPVRDLLARLGDPHTGPRVVHVAGSKGKGSVAALVAGGLWRAGLRVGTYASPHVERVNERVAIDGVPVSDDALADGLERASAVREAARREGSAGREATWFDTMTTAAFLVFADERVDWIVAECGLGGRLDSTNVLSGDVCVITGIELEHTAVLGSTRDAIAREKAGILEPGAALVTPLEEEDEAGRAVAEIAGRLGVTVARPQPPRGGSLETRNRALAELVLDELGRLGHLGADGAPLGARRLDGVALDRARLPGRMERFVRGGIDVVIDGAHTADSVRDVLRDLGAAGAPIVVLGLAREKDLAGILKTLRGRADRVLCTSVGSPLHRAPEQIEGEAAAVGLVAENVATPRMALNRALELARIHRRWVLVIGSLYLAGELRPMLRREETC